MSNILEYKTSKLTSSIKKKSCPLTFSILIRLKPKNLIIIHLEIPTIEQHKMKKNGEHVTVMSHPMNSILNHPNLFNCGLFSLENTRVQLKKY